MKKSNTEYTHESISLELYKIEYNKLYDVLGKDEAIKAREIIDVEYFRRFQLSIKQESSIMKNPFKKLRKKTKQAMTSKPARIAAATTAGIVAGTVVTVAVSGALARVPLHIGVRFLTNWITYSVVCNITEEAVKNELEEAVPAPPKV